MLIRNKTADAREFAVGDFSAYVEPGETVEVPDEVANGSPAVGKEFLDKEQTQRNPEFHPGTSGLLAQSDVWEVAKATKADKSTSSEENG